MRLAKRFRDIVGAGSLACVVTLGSGACRHPTDTHPRLSDHGLPEVARVVAQHKISEIDYLAMVPGGRYAVFMRAIVDLQHEKTVWPHNGLRCPVDTRPHTIVVPSEHGHGLVVWNLTSGNRRSWHDAMQSPQLEGLPKSVRTHGYAECTPPIQGKRPPLPPALRTLLKSLPVADDTTYFGSAGNGDGLLTGTDSRLCVWSLSTAQRDQCIDVRASWVTFQHPDEVYVEQVPLNDQALRLAGRWDLRRNAIDWDDHPLPHDAPVPETRWPSDQDACGIAGKSGLFYGHSISLDGAHVATLFDLTATEWALVIPDGRFSGSPDARRFLAFYGTDGELLTNAELDRLEDPVGVQQYLRRAIQCRGDVSSTRK